MSRLVLLSCSLKGMEKPMIVLFCNFFKAQFYKREEANISQEEPKRKTNKLDTF